LTQTTIYAAVLAKIGAEKSKLLSEAKMKTIIETKSLTEFTGQLRETTYQVQISKIPLPLSGRKLERAFNENLIETYIKMIKNTTKTSAKFLRVYLLRFEVENIKSLIKAVNAELSSEQKLARVYFSAEDYLKKRALLEEAAKASTLKQAVNAFKGTEYASALSRGAQSYEEKGSTVAVDVLLDKVFYDILYDHYQKLRKKEKPHAYFYASTESDSFLLLTILRGKTLNYDANWLRTAVPLNKFNLSSDTVEALLTAADFESALKIASGTNYGKFFAKAQGPEETIAGAEKAFDRAMFQHAKVSTISEIFNVGAPLAFMMLKEAEVHNLIAISAGVEASLTADQIQEHVLL
jgi:vacuolar-type H+-ATPase subunit C/Vma6